MNGAITPAIPRYAVPTIIGARGTRAFPFLRTAAAYATFVLLPAAGLLWVLHAGHHLPAATNPIVKAVDRGPRVSFQTSLFLTQIIIIIATARLLGSALRKLGQPRVVGEMLAGLILGPSLLGAVAPAAYEWLFPPGMIRPLNALSQTGIVLFMFLIGLELNVREMIRQSRESFVISHASIAIPMFAGGALALFFYHDFAVTGMPFHTFALFLGCAMSITAFPVLARILRESANQNSAFHSMVLGCAATADVSAWVILAFVISLARGSAMSLAAIGQMMAGITLYLLLMIAVVRPFLKMICRGRANNESDALTQNQLGIVLLVVLMSAVATELLNLHAIFGAFFAGLVMPHNRRVNETIQNRLNDLLSILLLPLFFAYAGLRANVASIATLSNWLACGAIIGVAVVSKIGGCVAAGRATGMSWRGAGAIGVLMNARGLMELVLLTIGLHLGIITPLLFTIMVVMAIATTLMATPIFTRLTARPDDIGGLSPSQIISTGHFGSACINARP
jgi:Kef-type K+ transport system membrane component KefB